MSVSLKKKTTLNREYLPKNAHPASVVVVVSGLVVVSVLGNRDWLSAKKKSFEIRIDGNDVSLQFKRSRLENELHIMEEEEFQLGEPIFHLKIVVNKEKTYETDLVKDFINFNPKQLRTIASDRLNFALTTNDKLDFFVTSISKDKTKTTAEVSFKDLSPQEFLDKYVNCGKTEGGVFLGSSTKWDCWNEKEIQFVGLAMDKQLYPHSDHKIEESVSINEPSKLETSKTDLPPLEE